MQARSVYLRISHFYSSRFQIPPDKNTYILYTQDSHKINMSSFVFLCARTVGGLSSLLVVEYLVCVLRNHLLKKEKDRAQLLVSADTETFWTSETRGCGSSGMDMNTSHRHNKKNRLEISNLPTKNNINGRVISSIQILAYVVG